MQVPAPFRAPAWVSTRRLLEQKLSDLHKCNDLRQLKQVHALIYKSSLDQDPFVIPKLITAFSLCRQIPCAIKAFNQVHEPNVHLYNTMIRAHVHNSQPAQAFEIFFLMQNSGVFPDNFTYPFLLKACSGQNDFHLVKMIHSHIQKFGFSSDIYVPNALIDSYSRCGLVGVGAAKKVFSVMEDKDTVSWNTMIGGLVKLNRLSEARQLFDEMPERDMVSWNTILDGYAKAGQLNDAFELFEKMPERNVVSWSTMLTGYSKAGDMDMTRMLFDKMPVKNMVSWTIIISGYAQKGLAKEAADLYVQMEEAGYRPDDGAIISILAACAESGLIWLGKRVHQSIKRNRHHCSTLIENALVDMYAKCGSLNRALSIFNGMSKKDLVSWNAMIHGLAMHGHGNEALELFSKMKQEGFTPDKVTFVGVLCACTHGGYIDEGIQYFYTMEKLQRAYIWSLYWVGDITITANRTLYVDFTLPYTDLGVGTLSRNAHAGIWIFMEPLSSDLWLVSASFFILLGFVIWILEHQTNKEFQGSSSQQIGTTLWFAFSTLVFAHRQKLQSNLSRFVVSVWLFVVLVLASSYTATLSSLFTIEQIRLASKGDLIGYRDGSFVQGDIVRNLNFKDTRLKPYYTSEEYADALSRGSKNGGVDAIIDEIPYLKGFLAQYPSGYSMVVSEVTTSGFGFAFPLGSPLVPELSRQISRLRENGSLAKLEKKWFKSDPHSKDSEPALKILNLKTCRGLFLISGVSMAVALSIFLFYFIHEKLHFTYTMLAGGKLAFIMRILNPKPVVELERR